MKELCMRLMAWMLVLGALSGCANTLRGAGNDIEKAGNEIEEELD